MIDGILPLWKEKGMTSHDCVFKIRKILKMKKVGHTGTLDPNVEGVLPICLDKGTKLVDLLTDKMKVYTGEITFGFSTDTEDLDGKIVDKTFLTHPFTSAQIDAGMQHLTGEIKQIPPMYSAVKVNGRRLYEYARAGETVERSVRTAMIFSFQRQNEPSFDDKKGLQTVKFEVVCGKGTYIRTLAYDLGQYLGVPATMTKLVRTGSSPFTQADCFDLKTIAAFAEAGTIQEKVWSIEKLLADLPSWQVPDDMEKLVTNGAVISEQAVPGDMLRSEMFTAKIEGKVKALYGKHPSKKGYLKPVKMF